MQAYKGSRILISFAHNNNNNNNNNNKIVQSVKSLKVEQEPKLNLNYTKTNWYFNLIIKSDYSEVEQLL